MSTGSGLPAPLSAQQRASSEPGSEDRHETEDVVPATTDPLNVEEHDEVIDMGAIEVIQGVVAAELAVLGAVEFADLR